MVSWPLVRDVLATDTPATALREMRERGSLHALLPEVDALFGVPQKPASHPEIDAGQHTLLVVEQAGLLSGDLAVRAAALLHDIGKAATPKELWPSHKGHEVRGAAIACTSLSKMGAPDNITAFVLLAVRWHGLVHKLSEANETELSELAAAIAALEQAEAIDKLGLVCMADFRGRLGYETADYDLSWTRILRERFVRPANPV